MAIPFSLPTDNDAEVRGEQLEQLMLDLYAALQQVLRSRTVHHPSRNHRLPRRAGDNFGSRDHPVVLVDSDLSRLTLPDLVLSAVEQLPATAPQVTVSAPSSPTRDAAFQFPECNTDDAPVPSPRPRPRRRRIASESGGAAAMKKAPAAEICNSCCAHFENQWVNVGANLRTIADDFHASKTKAAEIEKSRLPALNSGFANTTNTGGSTDSILSLLIPAPLRETLWTTVALYLGWRLVSRLR
ncbi:uncharacterized protein LOC128887947 [Hylaeus anthracinus]|uniref:uncharacterized protein LOC128873309 n=1 Tax=Hylaeus volcanicus TaxID=313075 RepID=UPI0023B804B8|nr:uncharacterized protein LOC128873309 [Hylaeus volcanicus]XP_053972775.1 uncharacterized protein LOC128873309 [Hylaeus volcanicus]XP_054000445.1 uncharacterized protein LOC128887947 [Hylaeus anthracinus]XP_054000446.1 uncharacterized protein LOC128887947 [Hylaeus anthracinus]XP_054000447.1 uncharacterized protein LOC128887947 [Hylaeus anthracinus]